MTFYGIYLLVKHFRLIVANQCFRLFIALFLCIFVPLLLSLPDAVNPGRALSSTSKYLVFPFILIFALIKMGENSEYKRKLFIACGIIIAFWVVDALIQYTLGYNILGYPHSAKNEGGVNFFGFSYPAGDAGGRLRGIFFPKQRLGTVTAALSPIVFDFVRIYARRFKLLWLLIPLTIFVILLSGSRNAWLILLSAGFFYFIYLSLRAGAKRTIKYFSILLLVFIVVGFAAYQVPHVKRYVTTTSLLFKGDFKSIDEATAYRLSLWTIAYKIGLDNYLNGIGPRGYRYVFREYAQESNRWYKTAQTHPHQMTLEIFTETGLIGISAYLIFWFLLFRFLLRLRGESLQRAAPWGIAAIVAMSPINSHMAFYGNYWSTISWWLLIIMVVMANQSKVETKSQTVL